jgi:hypothetical protein
MSTDIKKDKLIFEIIEKLQEVKEKSSTRNYTKSKKYRRKIANCFS